MALRSQLAKLDKYEREAVVSLVEAMLEKQKEAMDLVKGHLKRGKFSSFNDIQKVAKQWDTEEDE